MDIAALFGCAVLTGVGAVINCARVPLGASVAVVGLGGVGLSALLGAVACGAREIVAVDLLDSKLELARSLGATRTFNAADPDAAKQVREHTRGGVEYAFEMASSVEALALAYQMTRRGGSTVTASLPPPSHTFAVPAVQLVAEERSIRGSYLGSAVPTRDIPHFIRLFKAGRLPVDKLVTGRLRLDQINEGFDRLASGEAVRQVVVF
jgi:alcohol dehydrogenase